MRVPEVETKSAQEIEAFQVEKLNIAIDYLLENSPFYKNHLSKFQQSGLKLKSIKELTTFPVTTKDDLQKHNDSFLCVPKSKIVDYVTTSGTMGLPVSFAMSDSDLNRLAYNEAISLACSGVTAEDTIQLMTTMDRRFMAGLAYFLGSRKLGSSIIRVGSGVPELQWDSIKKFNPTFLICVPSFLLKMIDFAKKNKIDLSNTSVKGVICIGEPIRDEDFIPNALAKKILKDWNLTLLSTYASTEMSTAFNECTFQNGGHLHPELIIAEFLDKDNNPVKQGDVGELTITTLGVEAMPLLRFKTGDLMKSFHGACGCGRNTLRLGPVVGRTQQMIKYKGTTIYPPALDNLLNEFEEIEDYIIEIYNNELGTDEILLKLATTNFNINLDEIKNHFRAKIRVTPNIELVPIETIQKLNMPQMSRKPLKVIDRRKKNF